VAEHVGRRNEHAVEVQCADGVWRDELERCSGQSVGVAGDSERGDAAGAGVGRRNPSCGIATW
jgi:hypothetical protein